MKTPLCVGEQDGAGVVLLLLHPANMRVGPLGTPPPRTGLDVWSRGPDTITTTTQLRKLAGPEVFTTRFWHWKKSARKGFRETLLEEGIKKYILSQKKKLEESWKKIFRSK